ncbi:AAA family ATPase [Photobacterium profundum]|uniref:McrB family protein n=1 Tax=Photobacterium profundum TaxID=74109 RepID=UPI003D106458
MFGGNINSLLDVCSQFDSQMSIEYKDLAPSISFSNIGRNGSKYFSVSLLELIQSLEDIQNNFEAFTGHEQYVEKYWRDLFSTYLSSPVVNALSTVQTLPLFTVISKILYSINMPEGYLEKKMPLELAFFENAIEYLKSQVPDNASYLRVMGGDLDYSDFCHGGQNKIFYGAPGTGKSYSISQGRDEKLLIRTVFHPDTQYSDFVGCLKPVMAGDSIAYQFRPGPFTEAIIKAVTNPSISYSLVIEEINRAAAAAVFGEIFQLLDREADGSSTYSIDVSDPDLLSYLNEHTNRFFHDGKLKLPSNLSLLATMNSSDQAVMPMDTAFKRRWQFEYLRIDYKKASEGMLEFMVSETDGKALRSFRWADFAQTINECLSAEHIPEDRLLGHRFISENELRTNPEKTLTGKLFMYLWDDVLRHGQHTVIFRDSVTIDGKSEELVNFGQLVVAFEQGAVIFNEVVELRLKELSDVHAQNNAIETAAAESQDGV